MAIPTLKFDPKTVTPTVLAAAREMLLSFPEGNDELFEFARLMIQRGGDQPVFYQALLDRGLTKKRAAEISIEVNRRAISVTHRERYTRLGIVEARWIYPGVPCRGADHAPLNGQHYKLAEGMAHDGRFVHPGENAGCGCCSAPVVQF